MIKALKEDGPNGVPVVLLGLSFGNLDRLRQDEPIRLDVDQAKMLGLGECEVLIFAGPTELDMTSELEHHGLLPKGATDKARKELERR